MPYHMSAEKRRELIEHFKADNPTQPEALTTELRAARAEVRALSANGIIEPRKTITLSFELVGPQVCEFETMLATYRAHLGSDLKGLEPEAIVACVLADALSAGLQHNYLTTVLALQGVNVGHPNEVLLAAAKGVSSSEAPITRNN
jgi:hypothetical protein